MNEVMSFSEWKTRTLIELLKIYEEIENEEIRHEIDSLINKLTYLKSRDLSTWLHLLHGVAKYYEDVRKQLLLLVPDEKLLKHWFSSRG